MLGHISHQYLQDDGTCSSTRRGICCLFPCDRFNRRNKAVERYGLNALKMVLGIFSSKELD